MEGRGVAGAGHGVCVVGRSPAQGPDPAPTGGVVPAAATVTDAKPAAVVNGEAIPMTELEAVLKQAGPSPVSVPEEQRKAAQRQALAILIDDALMHQFLAQSTPKVGPEEVDKKLGELDAGLKKENRSLAEFCRDKGLTEAQIRSNIGYTLRWRTYARQYVTDAMVEKYYNDFKDFFDGVTVKASHIVLRLPPTAPAADLQAARDKLAAWRAEITAGKLEFAEAAKKNSQCPSAPGGGDIGYFPRKWVVDEAFAKAAFALKVGDVSDVVQSEYGLHLIKVTDRKAGQPSDFAKIKEDVREICTEDVRRVAGCRKPRSKSTCPDPDVPARGGRGLPARVRWTRASEFPVPWLRHPSHRPQPLSPIHLPRHCAVVYDERTTYLPAESSVMGLPLLALLAVLTAGRPAACRSAAASPTRWPATNQAFATPRLEPDGSAALSFFATASRRTPGGSPPWYGTSPAAPRRRRRGPCRRGTLWSRRRARLAVPQLRPTANGIENENAAARARQCLRLIEGRGSAAALRGRPPHRRHPAGWRRRRLAGVPALCRRQRGRPRGRGGPRRSGQLASAGPTQQL